MKTKVHFNLHKKCLSVQHGQSRVQHTNDPVLLEDVNFRVYLNGHKKVIEKKCRMVCAWAVGTQVPFTPAPLQTAVPVGYNPFRSTYFHIRDTGEAIHSAKRVWILGNAMYAEVSR